MALSALILNYLYIKNITSRNKIFLLLLIEAVSNSLILIPSGGIQSPFVWYSLNTILIASVLQARIFCWINLSLYLVDTIIISSLVSGEETGLSGLLLKEPEFILSFIVITAAMQFLGKYGSVLEEESRKLYQANELLRSANSKIKASMKYIFELNTAVQLLTAQTNESSLISKITEYTRKIAHCEGVFFLNTGNNNKVCIAHFEGVDDCLLKKVNTRKDLIWNMVLNESPIVNTEIDEHCFTLIVIKSDIRIFGILGIEITGMNSNEYFDFSGQIDFISRLASTIMDKFYLEQVNRELVLIAERDRIAGEMHDGVLQKLFSISCGIYGIIKKYKTSDFYVREDLNRLRNSINQAMDELRTAIYGLSHQKNGKAVFIKTMKSYIYNISKLHNVTIKYESKGNLEALEPEKQKGIFRIVYESVSNALRHGKANNIYINLDNSENNTSLIITDNGIGFDALNMSLNRKKGLGLINMRAIAESLAGQFEIDSSVGKGTSIKLFIPSFDKKATAGEIV